MERVQPARFKANERILKVGSVHTRMYFVGAGYARHAFRSPELPEEGIMWITFPGDQMANMPSFNSGQPSNTSLIAITDMDTIFLEKKELIDLYKNYHSFEHFGRVWSEYYLQKMTEQAYMLQFKTARERYELLIGQHPELLQLMPLGHIASYLGMTQETLSRVRSNLNKT